jgi:hypothetical protein
MTVRLKPLLAIAALAVALAAAAPAAAQQAPTLGAPETTQSDVAPPPETEDSGNGGLETWQEILIFCAGLALLLGIAFAILGDARERAGRFVRRSGGDPQPAGAGGATHKHRQQAKQRARAKSRAARAQRRKNR